MEFSYAEIANVLGIASGTVLPAHRTTLAEWQVA